MAVETQAAALESVDEVIDREEQIRLVVDLRTSGRIRGLQISVDGSRLIIAGQTSTYYTKQLATHAALDLADALVIQNDVVVG